MPRELGYVLTATADEASALARLGERGRIDAMLMDPAMTDRAARARRG